MFGSFPVTLHKNAKFERFLLKSGDSTLTQAETSWLNADSNGDKRDSTLTRRISLILTADSTLTQLI